ncbi:MAG: helix-turn-helix transcriptional regulator [Nitrospinota bacterium]
MIRRLRKDRPLSQRTLARRAKIGRITLLRIEQGTQDPTVGTVKRIARALRVKLRDLFPE